MRKVIAASVLVLLVLIISAVAFYYSQRYSVIPSDPLSAIPTDAAYILEVKNGKLASRTFTAQAFFKEWSVDSDFAPVQQSLKYVDSLLSKNSYSEKIWSTEKLFISAHPTKASDFDFLYLCNIPVRSGETNINDAMNALITKDEIISRRVYEDVNLYEVSRNSELIITYAFSKGILFASRTSFLVEDALRQLKNGVSIKKSKAFSKVQSDKKNDFTLYFNFIGLQNLLNGYIDPENQQLGNAFGSAARWAGFNLSPKGNLIELTGKMATTDTSNLVAAFQDDPGISTLPDLLPSRTAFVFELHSRAILKGLNRLKGNGTYFDDPALRQDELKTIFGKNSKPEQELQLWLGKSVALLITEAGNTVLENNSFAYIEVANRKILLSTLKKLQQAAGNRTDDSYKNYPVGTINMRGLAPLWFGKMFDKIQMNAFAIVKDRLIIANQLSNIKSLIDDLESKKIFSASSGYAIVGKTFFSGNINLYLDCSKGENIIRSGGNDAMANSLEKNRHLWNSVSSAAISINCGKDVLAKARINFSALSVEQMNMLWASQLDTTMQTSPCLITGANGNYISAQDKKNQLYLFDEAGRLIWKKQLPDPIKGSIRSADYYKNGGSQLLFNTSSALYLLDLKGENVGSFPVQLPAPAVNGCSVIDMDGYKQFRIFIGCENGIIYAYELSGKPVSDWIFNRFIQLSDEEIIIANSAGQTRLAFRDQNGRLFITDRKGKTQASRLEVSFNFPIEIAEDSTGEHFCAVNNSGQLITFNTEGIIKAALPPDTIHSYCSFKTEEGKNLIAAVSDDTLMIYNSSLELLNTIPISKGKYKFENNTSSKSTSALIEITSQKFYLLSNENGIAENLTAKGFTSYAIIRQTNAKRKLVLGDNDSGIYLYVY